MNPVAENRWLSNPTNGRPGAGWVRVLWRIGVGLAAARVLALGLEASDWPQFLGPERNGGTVESIRTNWPADGPKVVWSRDVGAGFSGPVVSGGRLVLHQRRGDEDVVECVDARRGGEPLWTCVRRATYRDDFGFDEGPRATPAISDGRVFLLGAEGALRSLNFTDGKEVWSVSLSEEYGAEKGFFGFACSPLVAAGVVVVNVGGREDAGIVAFDALTGKRRWKATRHEAGYASPVILSGGLSAAFFTREGLVIAGLATGKVEVEFPWRARMSASVNAATPLVVGTRVFLTTSYGVGAVLLETGDGKVRKVWSGDDSLSSHYASVVHREGNVFGFHGRQEMGANLRCVELATGKVRWTAPPMGSGSVLLAGERLVVLTERGELVIAEAASEAFKPTARAQVLGTGVRAFPALAGGLFYARDTKRLVCFEVGADGARE